MAKVNLGEKQACPECEKKFYDLTKRPAVCPYCSVSFDPTELTAKSSAVVSNVDEPAKDEPEADEEEVDEDEATAKELELDGDSANFGSDDGSDGDDDGDASRSTPDMDGYQSSDDEEDEGTSTDDEEDDALPPTNKEGEEPEEVEI